MEPNTASSSTKSESTIEPDEIDGISASCFNKNEKDRSINIDVPPSIYKEFYDISYRYNGYLLIFAHSKFIVGNVTPRPKVEEDIQMLVESFLGLNFHIFVKRDKRLREIRNIIKEASGMDFERYASFAIAISSHGNADGIMALDALYDLEEELIEPFKNTESLFGKPKMFFVGCCRGNSLDDGVSLLSSVETDGRQIQEYKIPMKADILIVYATIQGYVSYHNDYVGSQFFIYLTETLDDLAATRDLLAIITLANKRLATSFSSKNDVVQMNNKKQCMCVLSTLTRKLKFK